MTLAVKHAFVTAKSDGVDNTLVQPSNWNASHAITTAANVVIGCDGTGPGSAQELACTAQGRSILAAADLPALLTALGLGGFTTGDIKPTIKTTADAGWVLMNDGTIGDGASGATRANADTASLFTLLYSSPFTDVTAPLFTQGGAAVTRAAVGGGSNVAATAYGLHCRIQLLVTVGKTLVSNNGAIGATFGTPAYQIAANDLPLHAHSVPNHTHTILDSGGNPASAIKDVNVQQSFVTAVAGGTNLTQRKMDGALTIDTISTVSGVTTGNNTTLNTPIQMYQPSIYVTYMIKL